MYRVDLAVGDATGCTTDVEIDAPPFLLFEKMESLGLAFYEYSGCPDATGTNCAVIGGLVGGFQEPIEDGWLGRISSFAGNADSCTLGYDEKTATLARVAGPLILTIEHAMHAEQVSGFPCEAAEAERRGNTMPCILHDRTEATRL